MGKKIFSAALFCILAVTLLFSGCGSGDYKVKPMVNGRDYVILNDAQGIQMIYDDIGLLCEGKIDNKNCLVRLNNSDGVYSISEELTPRSDRYSRYAFSDNGYIAYVDCTDRNSFEYCVYSVSENQLQTFKSMKELLEYAEQHSVKLGDWFWNSNKVEPEKSVVKNNQWEIVTTAMDISAVRCNFADVFSGDIDSYYSNGDVLAFHFKLTYDVTRRLGTGNTFYEYLDLEGTGETKIDKYVVINTSTDEIKPFDSKKDAEDYISTGSSVKWEKVKY